MKKKVLGAVFAAVFMAGVAGSAGATPAEQKDLCKGGGYTKHTTAEGATFKNQGQCVSYVNSGGRLVPIPA